MEKKKIVVFTSKVAGYLICRGFVIKGIEPNKNNPKKNVYIFNDTEELKKAISEYDTFFEENRHWLIRDLEN